MLMDCDISVIKGVDNDELGGEVDDESPRKTVMMLNNAQNSQVEGSKGCQVKRYLKKIEAASKIQAYMLQVTLPAATTEEKKIMINKDLLKLSKYIGNCSAQSIKELKFSSTVASNFSLSSVQSTTLPNNYPHKSLIPSAGEVATPHRTPTRQNNKHEMTTATTPSSYNRSSFDRLITKLMSPTTEAKNKQPVVSPANSIKNTSIPNGETKTGTVRISNALPSPLIKCNDADNIDMGDDVNVLESIEDWKSVKKYLTLSSSSPVNNSPSIEPSHRQQDCKLFNMSGMGCDVEGGVLANCQVKFGNDFNLDEEDDSDTVNSRPPSPPPDMDEANLEVHLSMESFDLMSHASKDEFGRGRSSGTVDENVDFGRDSDGDKIERSSQEELYPVDTATMLSKRVVGQPEITWSTEFSCSGRVSHITSTTYNKPESSGLRSNVKPQHSETFDSPHNAASGSLKKQPNDDTDVPISKSVMKKSNTSVLDVYKENEINQTSPNKELASLRRNFTQQHMTHTDETVFVKKRNDKVSSNTHRKGLRPAHDMTPPRKSLQLPGNHADLRQVKSSTCISME